MGWFKRGVIEKSGTFTIAGETHPERSYGYLAVRWSVDNAAVMLERVLKIQTTAQTTSLVSRIKEDAWRVFTQSQVLYIAMYLAYAKVCLNVSERAMSEIYIGFQDGLKDLLAPNKLPIDIKLQSYIQKEVKSYISIIEDELSSDVQPGTVDFTGGLTCNAFIRSLHLLYSKNPAAPDTFDKQEILQLTAQLSHNPTKFMLILRDEINIKYELA